MEKFERFHVRKDLSLHVSSICSAFNEKTIGTKVIYQVAFQSALAVAIETFDMPKNGQCVIPLDGALDFVSGSMAKIDDCTEESDLCIRKHRGKWGVYARRSKAVAPDSLSCVVYTKAAYLADPDVTKEERLNVNSASHVIVAVLAACGPKSPMPPQTLLHNIAGGNNDFIPKTPKMSTLGYVAALGSVLSAVPPKPDTVPAFASDLALLHNFIERAQETEEYWSEWMLVAD